MVAMEPINEKVNRNVLRRAIKKEENQTEVVKFPVPIALSVHLVPLHAENPIRPRTSVVSQGTHADEDKCLQKDRD